MKNTFFSEKPATGNLATEQSWLSGEMLEVKPDRQDRLLGWWYKLTAIPEPPPSASFVKREAARRVRLFSTVAFFFILVLVIFIPGCLLTPNPLVIYMDLTLIIITLFTIFLNRQGRPFIAGTILVIISELVLAAVITTTNPLDGINLPLYDLFVVVDLLAVSLIQPQSIFVLAICNSIFMGFDLAYQPKTSALVASLATQFEPTLIGPVGLQLITAGIAYLWVRNFTRAIKRADKAEMIANLEHTIAKERSSSELAKKQLEKSIDQLVKTHTEAMNRQMVAKIVFPPEAKILWPLIGVINSLWVRLQRAHQTEYELYQLKQAVAMYAELLHQAQLTPQQPIPVYQTKTDLDALMLAVRNLQGTLRAR